MFKKNIALIGMMAAGKTTIGFKLAKKLNYNFFDLDAEIEKLENEKIINIFQIKGEAYFRKIEEKITFKVLKNKNAVIALGGGAFMNNEIREKVLKSCISVWLKLNLDKLIARYKRNNRRPLLNKKKLETDVKKIYQSRKKIYSLANFKINCDNITKSQIVEKILVFYEN